MTQEPIAYINVEKRTLEFAKKIFWHTPTVANLDRIPLFTKEALAQPEESQSALSLFQSGFIDGREKGLKEALAQTQEPVAWVVYSSAENDIVWADKGKLLKQNTPLYTTPPQRTWVGLTDEDKAILEAVHRELDRDCYEGNAPGHSHRTKGVWDEDNGKLAGKPCAWCLTWAKFTTLIKNEAAHGIKEKNT